MNPRRAAVLAAVWLAIAGAAGAAKLELASPFSDHMVLQREMAVPVWGWADPGEKIAVEFAGQSKTATAGADGTWRVKLDPMSASAEPRTLVVRSAAPARKIEIADVLVGEVWLGSGQSNMAMGVSRAKDYEAEKAAANLPLVRMFTEGSRAVATPQEKGTGAWKVCAPETVGTFSATLYFFGREVHRELKVPVGLINSSVGGTPIESWIAADVQAAVPELKAAAEAAAKAEADFDVEAAKADHAKAVARWKTLAEKAKAEGKPAPRAPRDPVETRARKGNVGGLFNGKIAPLIPYAIRGAVWYQGEANSHPGKGAVYQHQLPLLVTDWRARWGSEFPFAWVQLPNLERESTGDNWLLVREAMLKTLKLPKTGMAITVDIGDPKDIHPKNKQEVGRRLSLWALGDVYGRKVPETSGPLPAGHEIRGSEVVVSFTHAGGLKAADGDVKGFEVAGADKQWKPAVARIEGAKAVVSSPDVKAPVAVRYAWAMNPACNLVNAAGLPASPFRTDDGEAPTVGTAAP